MHCRRKADVDDNAPESKEIWHEIESRCYSQVAFEVLEADKRPVMADADSRSFRNVSVVKITSAASITHKLLFDPGHGLKERLIREQFV